MLKGKLYTVIDSLYLDQKINVNIALIQSHEIFKGHFPEMPILPGVCTIQIISEILAEHLNCKLVLAKGDNIKFLAPVNPNNDFLLKIEIAILQIALNSITVSCQVSTLTTPVFKMKGTYTC